MTLSALLGVESHKASGRRAPVTMKLLFTAYYLVKSSFAALASKQLRPAGP
jgi:hypothetical protein